MTSARPAIGNPSQEQMTALRDQVSPIANGAPAHVALPVLLDLLREIADSAALDGDVGAQAANEIYDWSVGILTAAHQALRRKVGEHDGIERPTMLSGSGWMIRMLDTIVNSAAYDDVDGARLSCWRDGRAAQIRVGDAVVDGLSRAIDQGSILQLVNDSGLTVITCDIDGDGKLEITATDGEVGDWLVGLLRSATV